MSPRPRLSDLVLRAQSDERLAALGAHGHERAFAILVERHRTALLASARRIAPAGRAEDIVQQTLLSAWASLTGGTEVRHVRGWLHQIVRNTAARVPADGPALVALDETLGEVDGPEATVEHKLTVEGIVDCVRSLPDAQRRALVEVAVEGRSGREVAHEIGVSEPALRQLVRRARVTLRTAVTALTPPQVAFWAASTSSSDHVVAGGAGAGLAAAKGVAVLASIGALGTAVAVNDPGRPADRPSGHAARPETGQQSKSGSASGRPNAQTAPAPGGAETAAAGGPAGATPRQGASSEAEAEGRGDSHGAEPRETESPETRTAEPVESHQAEAPETHPAQPAEYHPAEPPEYHAAEPTEYHPAEPTAYHPAETDN